MATKLLKEDRSPLERQQLLATLQASAERGADMVKKLLAFAGNTENQPTVSHPEPIIKEIKAIIDHTFPKTISLVLEMSPNLKPVIADTTQLSQVLMNLCINARDAMPHGGTLTIRAEKVRLDEKASQRHPEAHPGAYLCISVADEGMGIPPEIVHKIFDPFFTTKGPGKGTGLGLSSALGIVRSFGGFIDLTTQVGKGTRFAVYLLQAREDQSPSVQGESAEVVEGRGELLLLVDDEPLILKTTRATLENHGYRVITAEDGNEAISLFQKHGGEIQAAIVDLMMPGMDGFSTLAALEGVNAAVPLIASSGFPVSGPLAKEIAAGKKAFLAKPYTDGQILSVLAKALGRS
jgi:CheY-like chemotaxis protein